VKHLDKMGDQEIVDLNIPTGIPLVYELDDVTLEPIKHYYLGDQDEIQKKIQGVSNQGKSK
jgi:2,3-bisphosphoglycerate-dependent phosphoglycerate mutase